MSYRLVNATLTLAAVVTLFAVAQPMCLGQRNSRRSKTAPRSTGRSYTNIQQVDFRNFVYRFKVQQISMRKGFEAARNPKGEGGCSYLVETISYGDLNSDGQDEAAIVLGCTMAPYGSGYSNEGYVYTLRQGQPVLLAEFEGGYNPDLTLGTIVSHDGILIVVKDDWQSDPPRFQVITYKWNGRKLVEAARSTIRRP